MSRDNAPKVKNLLSWKGHVTMAKKDAYIVNGLQLQNHSLTFIHKNRSPLSATSILSRSPCLQHYCLFGQANLYRLCDFWQMSRQTWTIFMVQNWFQLLGCKTQKFQKIWQQRVHTRSKSYNGRGRFQPVFLLRKQLVVAAENFAREENLSRLLIPLMSKVMDEQLKLAHKIVDVVDWKSRKICVILLPYDEDKPESSYA